MTPQQTIQKIRDAIVSGTLADAEKALEDYVVAFDKWRIKNQWQGVLEGEKVEIKTSEQLYQSFLSSFKKQ